MEVLPVSHPESFGASASGIGNGMMSSSTLGSMGSSPATTASTTTTTTGMDSEPTIPNKNSEGESSSSSAASDDQTANKASSSSSSAGMDVGNHDERGGTAASSPSSNAPFKSFEPSVLQSIVENNPSSTSSSSTTGTSTSTPSGASSSLPASAADMIPPSILSSLNFGQQSSLLQQSVDSSSASPSGFLASPPASSSVSSSSGSSLILPSNSPSSMDGSNPNQGALVRSNSFNEKGTKYIDLTDYLALPQTEAARRLGIPTSTLSKRWKEAVVNRKWPYRMVCKLNKEIMTLLHNVPQGPGAPPLPPEIEQSLGILLRRRQEELRGVVIRV